MPKFTRIIVLFFLASCALSGRSNESGLSKYVTGATKVGQLKDVHVINIFRAIGTPNNNLKIDKYKYYYWDYSRTVGVSAFLTGATTTLYCKLSVETQNEKIQLVNWYGNQCDIFLDQIRDYFQDKLNIAIINEEDSKEVTPRVENKSEHKSESKIELPKLDDKKSDEKKVGDSLTPAVLLKETADQTIVK